MKLTNKTYTIVIVRLLASCFTCRNVSLGLFTELRTRKCGGLRHPEGQEVVSYVKMIDSCRSIERSM